MTNKEKQILDGLIISDGHLSMNGKNARLSFTLKHKGFAEAIIENLPSLRWNLRQDSYFDKRTKKRYRRNQLKTRVDKYLTSQFERWYPSGKKIVPKDINIDTDFLLWWYLGDGHLERKKSRPNYRRVCLSTESFSKNEISSLITKLNNILGKNSIYPENKRIMIGRQSLCKFADILKDQNSVREYNYKFDFGQYVNSEYFENSYKKRPLTKINAYRKQNKVREFNLELLEEMNYA